MSIQSPNIPLNVPSLEALESMTGFVPEDVREQILASDFRDDLSGLREIARRQRDPDGWADIVKPKQEIADYVEAFGVNTPQRYESLDEALYAANHGRGVIARSEHPQEYDQFSGLLDSVIIDQAGAATIDKLIKGGLPESVAINYVNPHGLGSILVRRFAKLAGQPIEEFIAQQSFSFWEYIPGTNLMVVADDAIADRYHITGINFDQRKASGWLGNSEGVVAAGTTFSHLDEGLVDQPTRVALIGEYEKIRNLPKFSARQCPIMEFQMGDDGKLWFLQYHKARPFRPSPERLSDSDYPEAEGWLKAEGVRGAIGSLVTLKAALWYPGRPGHASSHSFILKGPEDASFDHHYDVGLTEFASPNRIAYISNKSHESVYAGMADGGHEVRSRWFKPFGALSLGKTTYEALLPDDLRKRLLDIVLSESEMARVVLDVASDGLKGYVRLNPETEEQPVITAD